VAAEINPLLVLQERQGVRAADGLAVLAWNRDAAVLDARGCAVPVMA
jgi:hypothetical protein